MKKIFFILSIFLTLFSFSSCEKDESLDPLPTIVSGQFIRLEPVNKLLSFDQIDNTYFSGLLTNPGNNVVRYELFVRYTTSATEITSQNYVSLLNITSFPYDLKITPQMLATALGKNVSDFEEGSKFNFLAYAYDANGNVTDYNSLSSTVKTQPGMKQAFKFLTKLVNDLTISQTPNFNIYE